MNLVTASPGRPQPFVATGKGNLLPTWEAVAISDAIRDELCRKLSSVIHRMDKGLFCTFSRREDLYAIAGLLGQQNFRGGTIRLFGYEVAVLYQFTLEQERWRDVYNPESTTQARRFMWAFIEQLNGIRDRVDVYASRPIMGNR